MRASSADGTSAAQPHREREDCSLSRRLLLRRLLLAAAPLAGLVAGACEKPYYDRDRGVMVFRRPRKN